MSAAEEALALHLRAHQISGWEREYRFGAHACGGPGKGLRQRSQEAGLKDWRFDFAFPALKVAVEVEGGGWSGGRHTRGKGFAEDLRKYEAAMRMGWNIYRCSPEMVKQGAAVETIKILIEQAGRANG